MPAGALVLTLVGVALLGTLGLVQWWYHGRRGATLGKALVGLRTVDALHAVLAFFEERRGRLYGFRFRDRVDCKSCSPSGVLQPNDQPVGIGDGVTT